MSSPLQFLNELPIFDHKKLSGGVHIKKITPKRLHHPTSLKTIGPRTLYGHPGIKSRHVSTTTNLKTVSVSNTELHEIKTRPSTKKRVAKKTPRAQKPRKLGVIEIKDTISTPIVVLEPEHVVESTLPQDNVIDIPTLIVENTVSTENISTNLLEQEAVVEPILVISETNVEEVTPLSNLQKMADDQEKEVIMLREVLQSKPLFYENQEIFVWLAQKTSPQNMGEVEKILEDHQKSGISMILGRNLFSTQQRIREIRTYTNEHLTQHGYEETETKNELAYYMHMLQEEEDRLLHLKKNDDTYISSLETKIQELIELEKEVTKSLLSITPPQKQMLPETKNPFKKIGILLKRVITSFAKRK